MEMTDIFFWIGIALYAVLVITHILPLFMKQRGALGHIGIALHAAFIIFLFLGGAPLSLLVLLCMASIAVHAASSYLIYRRETDNDV